MLYRTILALSFFTVGSSLAGCTASGDDDDSINGDPTDTGEQETDEQETDEQDTATDALCEGGHVQLEELIEEDLQLETGCYVVEETTVSSGATLTIAVGSTVFMKSGAFLKVDDGGSMVAVGSFDDPVMFTSIQASPLPGDWGCIHFGRNASGSEMDHVVVEYGGSPCAATGADHESAVYVDSAIRKLDDTYIHSSSSRGLTIARFGSGAPRSMEGVILESNEPPSLQVGAEWMGEIGDGISFDNAEDYIFVDGDVAADGEVQDLGVPWRIPAGWGPVGNDVLTITAGVVLESVGGSIDASIGTLEIIGTESDPVEIRSAKLNPEAGDWGCLELDEDDKMDYVIVRHGGSGACTGANYETAIFSNGAGAALSNLTIVESAGSAIQSWTCSAGNVTALCDGNIVTEDVTSPALTCRDGVDLIDLCS